MLSIWDPFTFQEGWGTGDLDLYVYLFYNQLHNSFSTFPGSLVMVFFPPKGLNLVAAIELAGLRETGVKVTGPLS